MQNFLTFLTFVKLLCAAVVIFLASLQYNRLGYSRISFIFPTFSPPFIPAPHLFVPGSPPAHLLADSVDDQHVDGDADVGQHTQRSSQTLWRHLTDVGSDRAVSDAECHTQHHLMETSHRGILGTTWWRGSTGVNPMEMSHRGILGTTWGRGHTGVKMGILGITWWKHVSRHTGDWLMTRVKNIP